MANIEGGTPDQFAALVLQQLTELGEQNATYNSGEFCIELDNGFNVYLKKLHEETLRLPEAERATHIGQVAAALRSRAAGPQSWAEVRPLLRPILRPYSYSLEAPVGAKPLARPAFPFLQEMVAIDMPEFRTVVYPETMQDWDVTVDEIFAVAHANLAALVDPHESDGKAVRRYSDEDGSRYFSSWPLVPGWLAGFRARYGHRRPVAFMPDVDTLFVVPDVPDLLEQIYPRVEQQYRAAAHPVSPQGYTLDDNDRVVPFDQAGPHEQLAAAQRARSGLAVQEYGAQGQWLNELIDDDPVEALEPFGIETAFVNSVMYVPSVQGPCTVTVWGQGLLSLLPETDYIMFIAEVDGQKDTLFEVPFAEVVKIVELTPIPGLLPIRYDVRTWPTSEQLVRLGAAAVTLRADA